MVIRAKDYQELIWKVEEIIENIPNITKWYLFQKDVYVGSEWDSYDLALVILRSGMRPRDDFYEQYEFYASMEVDMREYETTIEAAANVEWIIDQLRDALRETK